MMGRGRGGANLLVSVLPRGQNDTYDASAFTDSEIDALEHWVHAGGSLLLIADHWPYGAAVVALAQRFGVVVVRRSNIRPRRLASSEAEAIPG